MAYWKRALKDTLKTSEQLLTHITLTPDQLTAAKSASELFALKVPQAFANRVDFNNPSDPLLKQFLPVAEELLTVPGYQDDPLHEQEANAIPGLLHKYHSRVLLIVSGHCAINCRYCFRRTFAYHENNPGKTGWQKALEYIRQDPSIEEVILSGGDPLVITDAQLQFLITELNSIPHLTTLRFHTRVPIVMPERITSEFLAIVQQSRLQKIMIVHCNHANELSDSVIKALQQLKKINVTLMNQSVLLKGVNDHSDTLISLSKALFAAGVLPYYLHMLDPVTGTAHFAVELDIALQLMRDITAKLPGYLVPKLVREVAGETNKQLIMNS